MFLLALSSGNISGGAQLINNIECQESYLGKDAARMCLTAPLLLQPLFIFVIDLNGMLSEVKHSSQRVYKEYTIHWNHLSYKKAPLKI